MIRALGEDVRSLLRSGIAVSNLTQCIDELVVNSLDAGATCVTIRVDIPVLQLQVSDNGTGISRDNLVALGQRYATSKCHSLNDLNDVKFYGFRGEALASIREVAGILEIVTRHKSSYKTYCKTYRNDKAVEITESCIPRSGVGTTVTVYDMFSSLPVRRKLVSDVLDFERIRQRVASIALIHPGVSFSLFNGATGQKSLQTRKCQSIVSTFSQLFGNLKAKSLQELSLVNGDVAVSGFVGLQTHHSKHLQFVYVNGRLLLKTRIHKLTNQVLAKSLLIKKPVSSDNENEEESTLKSPPKQGCDKFSIYIINITCPVVSYDITFEPSKTLVEFEDWENVLGLIKKCLESFLVKRNLMLSADTTEGDLAECQDSESDNSDSQIDLSVYEYQTDTAKPLDYLINPDNIKKSLVSSVVSRSKKQDEEVNTLRDNSELTDKEELLDKVESDVLPLKESNCPLQKGEDTLQRTAALSYPPQQPGRKASLPGKGFSNTCRRGSCFNSPNPITLKQRKTQKHSDTRITKNLPNHASHHNHTSLVNSRKQFRSPDKINESPSKIMDKHFCSINENLEKKSYFSSPRSTGTNQCVRLDNDISCERDVNQKDDDVTDDAMRDFDIIVSHEDDDVCDKELDEVMQEYESISDRGKLPTASRSRPNRRDGQTNDSTQSSHWQVTYDNNLKKNIYYNTRTGNTVFECPFNELTDQEICKKRTLRMACAPHLSFDCTPWLPRDSRQRRTVAESTSKNQEGPATLLSTMLNEWENPVFETVSEMDVTSLSKPSVARNSLQKAILSYRFTKEMVKTLCVINQVDNKFIVCKAQGADDEHDSLVVLLDQHAVHERIRMEKLTED